MDRPPRGGPGHRAGYVRAAALLDDGQHGLDEAYGHRLLVGVIPSTKEGDGGAADAVDGFAGEPRAGLELLQEGL